MKKILLLIFILNLFQHFCFGQKHGQVKIDSLLFVLQTEREDTNKVNTLNELCNEYETINDYVNGVKYGNIGLTLAKKIYYKKGEAESYTNSGIIYYEQLEYSKALDYLFNSLKIREVLGDKKGVANNYANVARVYKTQFHYQSALDYYSKSITIFEKEGNMNKVADVYASIGLIYDGQSDYPKALGFYFKSLKIDEIVGDKEGAANNYCNIGGIYTYQLDYPKALSNFFSSLKIYEALDYKIGMGNCCANIGNIYMYQKKYQKAFEYHFKGLNFYKEIGYKMGMSLAYMDIGELYLNYFENDKTSTGLTTPTNQYISYNVLLDSAIALNKKALKINLELKDKYYTTYSYSGIGNVLFRQRKYKEAIDYYQQSYLFADSIGALKEKKDAAKGIADSYKKLEDWKKALIWYEKYSEGKDSVFNEAKDKDITRKELKFDYEKKAVADSVKAGEEKKVISAELKQEQTKSYALYSGVALLLVFGGFMFNRFKITQRQKNIIAEQKNVVEVKNKEITQSIEYALRIQTAILPPPKIVKQYLENSFILYKPKDIVAGDFYWMETVNDLVLFAACDCTGHGVPGAMVSVVCHNALNRAVKEFGLTQPAAILDKTAEIVIENFSKSEEDIKDGMDISLCAYNAKTKTIQWAGANNPLWLLQSGELIETKADKQPIGMNENSKPFTNHTFTLQTGETIYLFTDGFADQFGGETGQKKLTKKRFKDLILSVQNKTLQEQGIALDKFITEYRKEVEQIDDILVMGVKV